MQMVYKGQRHIGNTSSEEQIGWEMNGSLRANGNADSMGGHREMAIDVPSSFIPHPKEKPHFGKSSSNASLENRPQQLASNGSTMSLENQDKIKKYQGELKQRKEQEKIKDKEQEFLRASLRESKKLQNLENRRDKREAEAATADGFTNSAFDDEISAPQAERKPVGKFVDLPPPTVDSLVTIKRILALLQALQSKLGPNSKEVRLMNQLFNSVKFQDAVEFHNQVQEAHRAGMIAKPVTHSSAATATTICSSLQQSTASQAKQLGELLQKPALKSLFLSHDLLAQTLPKDEEEPGIGGQTDKADQYGDQSVKIITLHKTADPLGATVRNEGETVLIGRIVRGGVADKTRLLHEGDELLEVNGVPMRGKTINEVSELLASMTGSIQFVIVPAETSNDNASKTLKTMSVRALFDYDPEEDAYIPCQELGISFQTGDILNVINQDDPSWWQAYREGEEDQALAGLIPSKTFWETWQTVKQQMIAASAEAEDQNSCCPSSKKRRRKVKFDATEENEEILTYEEVTKYYPQPNRKRPIVLIGPPDVGRKELMTKLVDNDPDRFADAIPHTTRPRKDDEVDGKDFYFTARHLFEADIRANKFVEHGLYQKDYYGTSIEAIRNVYMSGKVCVLNLHPQALKALRATDLKPYVVFVAPPNLERLRANLQRQGGNSSVEHCQAIIDKGREMETKYAHYFEFIIRNNDLEEAYHELLAEINRLDVEPQWIPIEWVRR